VFVGGMAWRVRTWLKTPQPAKMTLFPKPADLTRSVLAEALLFPSLFRGDRGLWTISWVFHVTLAVVFLGHVRVFTGMIDAALGALGVTPDGVAWMSGAFGGAAGVILLATGCLLVFRRLAIGRVREISNASDFFALLLLLGIFVTGDVMRFGEHFDLGLTHAWAASLLTLSPQVPANGMFMVHAGLAMTLLMYVPFSKILHFGGIFFTQALVKR